MGTGQGRAVAHLPIAIVGRTVSWRVVGRQPGPQRARRPESSLQSQCRVTLGAGVGDDGARRSRFVADDCGTQACRDVSVGPRPRKSALAAVCGEHEALRSRPRALLHLDCGMVCVALLTASRRPVLSSSTRLCSVRGHCPSMRASRPAQARRLGGFESIREDPCRGAHDL